MFFFSKNLFKGYFINYKRTENSANSCTGIRIKNKFEVTNNRRVKRDSISNRNRFDIDLYDELTETLKSGQPLKHFILCETSVLNVISKVEPTRNTSSKLPLTSHVSSKAFSIYICNQASHYTRLNLLHWNRLNQVTRAVAAMCRVPFSTTNKKWLLEEWRGAR